MYFEIREIIERFQGSHVSTFQKVFVCLFASDFRVKRLHFGPEKDFFDWKKCEEKRPLNLIWPFQTRPNDSRALFPNKWAYKKGRSGVRTIYDSICSRIRLCLSSPTFLMHDPVWQTVMPNLTFI